MQYLTYTIHLLTTMLLLFANACMMKRVSETTQKTQISNKTTQIYRLIFLVKSDICIKLDKKNKTKCVEYGASGWYPVEFVRSNFLRYTNHYAPKWKRIIYNIPTYLLRNYTNTENSRIIYKPEFTIDAFSKIPRRNAILVKLHGFEQNINWSSYLTVASLLIIPGYFEEDVRTEIIVYNAQGKKQPHRDTNEPYLQLWLGWIFFGWGVIASDSKEDLLISKINHSLQNISKN